VLFSALAVFYYKDALVGCHGQSSVTVTPNESFAPAIQYIPNQASSRPGRRASLTAQNSGLHLIAVANVGSLGGAYSFRATDTTLVNPRWSTCGGYFSHWGLLNVSDMTVTGVFSIFDTSGRQLASTAVTLAPGAEQFHTSLANDMNIAAGDFGYATFSHNGPPDAVIGDSYMVSANGAIIYVSRFERTGSR
jgi:hypothetical protein